MGTIEIISCDVNRWLEQSTQPTFVDKCVVTCKSLHTINAMQVKCLTKNEIVVAPSLYSYHLGLLFNKFVSPMMSRYIGVISVVRYTLELIRY